MSEQPRMLDPSLLAETPEETKQNVIQEMKETTGISAEDDAFGVAATMFGIYLPRFKAKIKELNAKAVERLLMALIEVPISEKDYTPLTKEEKECFLIGQSLMEAKMLMIMDTLRLHEQSKLAEKPVDNVTETGDNKENSNNG
jgi:hypothetical protein